MVKEIKIISFLDFEDILDKETNYLDKIDAIIPSGSTLNVSEFKKSGTATHSVTKGGKIFQSIIETLLNSRKPILAVCFGMQLLVYHYDEESIIRPSSEIPDAVKEVHRIKKLDLKSKNFKNDPLFCGFNSLNVDFNHSDYIIPTKMLQNEMKNIEIQKYDEFQWVQYFRHKNGIYFGVQFQPECKTINKYN